MPRGRPDETTVYRAFTTTFDDELGGCVTCSTNSYLTCGA
jgi:hypothetical protein